MDQNIATPSPLACYDCGLPYADPGWCDVAIPDQDWLAISPTGHEGGVLCLTCIARRLVGLGRRDVPLVVTSGPWRWSNEWTDWLARNGYGIDFNYDEDPPCTLTDLATAYARNDDRGEAVETWAWCIQENTGAFADPSIRPGKVGSD